MANQSMEKTVNERHSENYKNKWWRSAERGPGVVKDGLFAR